LAAYAAAGIGKASDLLGIVLIIIILITDRNLLYSILSKARSISNAK
jgi:hypothetical protein